MDSRLEQRGSAGSTSVAHGRAARGAGSVTAVPCDGLFRFAETNSHRNNDCYTFMGGGSYRTDTDPGMSKPRVGREGQSLSERARQAASPPRSVRRDAVLCRARAVRT